MAAAWPVTLPAVGEMNVIVHWPLAFVFGPALVQVPVAAVGSVAPLSGVSVTVDVLAAAGPKPAPLSFSSVTVKVCGWPISFVAFGVIEIRAATQTFVAGPELAPTPFVSRRQRDAADRDVDVRADDRGAGGRRGDRGRAAAGRADRGARASAW